jgi:hypothetical protein
MFKLLTKIGNAPFEYPGVMKANEACAVGEALSYDGTDGTLTKCAATGVPDYIAQQAVAASATPTVKPGCIRVTELQEWQTVTGTGTAAIVVGSKLTLHTDGLTLTATPSGGVFQVTSTPKAYNAASAAGDIITGMFRR